VGQEGGQRARPTQFSMRARARTRDGDVTVERDIARGREEFAAEDADRTRIGWRVSGRLLVGEWGLVLHAFCTQPKQTRRRVHTQAPMTIPRGITTSGPYPTDIQSSDVAGVCLGTE
jgi:hypothetical protein